MARKYTGKEVHGVVDEGRTGRIVARMALRRGLGNPKKREKALREFGLELYLSGFKQGGEYMRGRIHNSTVGLDYGHGYFVQPVSESEKEGLPSEVNAQMVTDYSSDPESDGPLAFSTPEFPQEWANPADGNCSDKQQDHT
jgi:hypothetical protein